MESGTISEVKGDEVTGCPVMHQDFSTTRSLGDYWALANCHYMPGQYIYQFDRSIRAVARPQMELMAARVSALHQCVY